MTTKLLAIKAERRAVGIAVFDDNVLRYAEGLSLSSDPAAAEASAVGFVIRNVERFDPGSAVIEDAVREEGCRSAHLIHSIESAAASHGVPVHRVPKETLFASYGVTPLVQRHDLQKIVGTFWPQLNTDFLPAVRDAAAAGLFEATENRLQEEAGDEDH